MTAKIIPLFPNAKGKKKKAQSCFDCVSGYYGQGGVLCEVMREFVMDETEAEDCEYFDRRGSNGAA